MEDQEIMDQFVENRQSYVIDNMNAVAGCENIGVGECVGSTGEILGVKYDEQLHEGQGMGDDDELKYVKEVQQSEKQLLKNSGDGCNSNELAEKEEATKKYEVGNVGEDNDFQNVMFNFGNGDANGHNDDDVVEMLSPNIASLKTDDKCIPSESVSAEHFQEYEGLGEDEDPNSLATNTTGNSSSLSENITQPLALAAEEISFTSAAMGDQTIGSISEKFIPPFTAATNNTVTEDLKNESNEIEMQAADFDHMQSQLNPDAKEFVPSFESNPTSPSLTFDTGAHTSEDEKMESIFFGLAVNRHVIAEDDFVAQSPRKGRGDNMDIISLPAEREFEKEADQRPHELEQENQVEVGEINSKTSDTFQESPKHGDFCKDIGLQDDEDIHSYRDCNTNDHGPETSVDIGTAIVYSKQPSTEISEYENDLMKQSLYVTKDEAIEDVLNSVQPIPTEIDSVNNSFSEEMFSVAPVGEKELLQVEEKEHISNSPSTEEIQMNPDISKTQFDMKEVSTLGESILIDQILPQEPNTFFLPEIECLELQANAGETKQSPEKITTDTSDDAELVTTNSEKESSNLFDCSIELNEQNVAQFPLADEKHLLEETKEQAMECSIDNPIVESVLAHTPTVDEKHLIEETKEVENRPNISDIGHQKIEFEINVSDDKCSMQNTKEMQLHPTESSLEHLMSEMAITGDILSQQVGEKLAPAVAVYDVTAHGNVHSNTVDKCEQIMVVDQDPTEIVNDVTHNLPSQELNADNDKNPMHFISEYQPITEILERSDLAISGPAEKISTCEVLEEPSQTPSTANVSSQILESSLNDMSTSNLHEFINQREIIDITEPSITKDNLTEPVAFEHKKYDSELDLEDTKESAIEKAVDSVVTMKVDDVIASGAAGPTLHLLANNTDTVKKTESETLCNVSKAKTAPSYLSSSKKPTITEVAKKTTNVVSKPKLPAARSVAVPLCSDKKPTKATTVGSLTARKTVGVAATAPKNSKSAATSSTPRTLGVTTAKTTAARPTPALRTIISASSVRKPATNTSSAAKPRPASASSSAPAKASTLGGPPTNITTKQKLVSPRATLTSQLRKTAPPSTTIKSPIKTTTTNSLTKPVSSSLANRSKPTSSGVNGIGSTSTKQITARAAPKISTSTTTTTRRLSTTTTQTASKVTSNTTRKSSPIKPATGKPIIKTTTSTMGLKPKSVTKASPNKTNSNKINEQVKSNGEKSNDMNGNIGGTHATTTAEDQEQSLPQNEDLLNARADTGNSADLNSVGNDHIEVDLIGA